ncbi:MAG TPA: PQQ-dependent sugar dehydrogenase [Gemmatimonadales bacterium]|nr:PQQ-dependent sugar dehydrogenase [Gemmatimonadales bacterium]
MTLVLLTAPRGWAQGRLPPCDPDNAGLTLPLGFCALIVADSVGRARHLVVAENGDVFVALRGERGGVLALRDTTGDGRADVTRRFGPAGGTGIARREGYLYFATDDAVVRWAWRPGQLEPAGPPDTVVAGLLNRRQHAAKAIVFGRDGMLYVNIGVPSNACQAEDRVEGSKGMDPCPLLEQSGGIWRFDPARLRQTQADGVRYATGLRNTLALAVEPRTGALYGAVHGRDVLHGNWPGLFTEAQSAEKPAEELFRIEEGGDYGWPYCYYDPELKQKVLAPEYGGDGRTVGRCAATRQPEVAFPAHWGPNAMVFYTGSQFPARYRGGLFVAFHGSWNRAPLPQAGYNVVFAPFSGGRALGTYEVFAEGFAGPEVSPRGARHRPSGVALGPDGSLYVSDDQGGRIYRIVYAR